MLSYQNRQRLRYLGRFSQLFAQGVHEAAFVVIDFSLVVTNGLGKFGAWLRPLTAACLLYAGDGSEKYGLKE